MDDVDALYRDIVRPSYTRYTRLIKQDLAHARNEIHEAFDLRADGNSDVALARMADAGLHVCQETLIFLVKRIRAISDDREKSRWCAQASSNDIERIEQMAESSLNTAEDLGRKANSAEQKIIALRSYDAAINEYMRLLDCFDEKKLADFNTFRLHSSIRANINALLVGVAAGVVAGLILSALF